MMSMSTTKKFTLLLTPLSLYTKPWTLGSLVMPLSMSHYTIMSQACFFVCSQVHTKTATLPNFGAEASRQCAAAAAFYYSLMTSPFTESLLPHIQIYSFLHTTCIVTVSAPSG